MKVTARPVVDRLAPRNQRTRYTGEGLCLGAQVVGLGALGHVTSGQVWSQGDGKTWWVVTPEGEARLIHENDLHVVGHAHDQSIDMGVAA
jgi:hypothetical protein